MQVCAKTKFIVLTAQKVRQTEYMSSMPKQCAGGTIGGSQHGPHLAALQSARVWLALDPDGAGTACVSPGNLMQSQVQSASSISNMRL